MTSAKAGSFEDHPRKIHFRKNWAKPILEYLSKRLGKKLIYLGLPGYRALDILEWKEFLQIVIAFQANNYDERDVEGNEDEEMHALINILNELEEKKIIETYALYKGYIEQVVMEEEDDDNEPFDIRDYITIYNLDFCNTLSKPFPVIDKNFNTYDCSKIDVIEKLLSIEREKFMKGSDGAFVMFLTVNSHFLESMVSVINDSTIKNYISKTLKGIVGDKRTIRLLKAYTFYKLNEIFAKQEFNIEILPTIYYKGSGTYYDVKRQKHLPFWLLTFTILGTPYKLSDPKVDFQQDFQDFLNNKFVFIADSGITCFTDQTEKIIEKDFSPEILKILENSHTVNHIWKHSG